MSPKTAEAQEVKEAKPIKTKKKGGWPKGKKRVKSPVKKKVKRRGRPKGSKNISKPGRPIKKTEKPASGNSINLPLDSKADLQYWSEFITFLNINAGKAFTVQTNGTDYSLHVS